MSVILNKDAIKAIFDGARMPIQDTPVELGKTCVPVMDMTPDFHRYCNIVKGGISTASGNIIVYTTPTDKEFYLNSVQVHLFADVASDVLTNLVYVSIDGVIQTLMGFRKASLTAQNISETSSYPTPLKLDKGTEISLTGSFGSGVHIRNICITGFTKDIN